MGKCRFLYNNLITSETMITLSSLRTGLVSTAVKEGSGSAVLTPSGLFSGAADLEYSIEIDGVGAGKEVDQATFKWSDGGGTWDATTVATAHEDTLLNNAVNVKWASVTGDDFALGDKWWFRAWNLFNAQKMIDLNRDTRYRSAALQTPNTLTINLGSALEIKALIIGDHNLTSGATIALAGHTADSWGTPDFTEAIAWNSESILHYLSTATTKRYWQIQITDATNPDGYIEIGELFLGSYLELSKNFDHNASYPVEFIESREVSPYGVPRFRFYNLQNQIGIQFSNLTATDWTNLSTMLTAMGSRSTGIKKPFWFNDDSAIPGNLWLMEISGLERTRVKSGSVLWNVGLSMREIVKSV